jgi:Ca2+-binding RTX toxin-like protein
VSGFSTRQGNALTTLALAVVAGGALTLPSPAAAATTCTNVERGTQAPDTLVGTTEGDLLQAGGGSDEVNGLAGPDCLAGGRESDLLKPGAGVDRVQGGGGRDKLVTRDGSRDVVRCGRGRDTVVADWRDRVKRSCDRVVRKSPNGRGTPARPAGDCAIDPATMTAPGCSLAGSDTSSKRDPGPRWGNVECASDSRASEVTNGGDPHPTATGAPQGNSAYRRLTVLDGDNFYGERCELGRNEQRYGSDGGKGTFQLYREGQHRITYISYRLPSDYPLENSNWQGVMQMKQAQPASNGGGGPVLSFDAAGDAWRLRHSLSVDYAVDSSTLWSAPAQRGVWTRFAFDVVYSQDPDIGQIKVYADLNGDGDASDPDEQSPTFHTYTLKRETADTDYRDAGDSETSHLRVGIYHNSAIPCPAPSGCSVGVDNVEVVGPVVGVSAGGQTTWRVLIVGPNGGQHVYDVTADSEGEAKNAGWAKLRADSTTSAIPTTSSGCDAEVGSDPLTASIPACAVLSEDTAQSSDPAPLWGNVECASDSRASLVASGGDPHPTATGAPQGNSAYRRLTVLDGDDFYGERCELGRNEQRYGSDGGAGTFQLYGEGQRRITFASLLLPEDFPIDTSLFQSVLRMKQTQPSDNGGGAPVLSLDARNGRWNLLQSDSAGYSSDTHVLWSTPAETGVWVRVALDVTYSQHSDEGKVKLYLDRNGDGDSLDAEEQSPTFTTHTLKYETPDPDGNDTDGLAPGESIPSHLRVGLFHDSDIDCPAPSGCSVQLDNLQVVRP